MEIPNPANAAGKTCYTAVVYFHGMGSQRRYEELGRLIDALDRFSHSHTPPFGRLKNIHASVEPPRSLLPREVGFVSVTRQGSHIRQPYRFYEAYWAHVTAGGVPVREVLVWLVNQVTTPLQALRTPWRLRARLRRAALLEIWPRLQATRADIKEGDLKRLLDAYDQFEGWEARRQYPDGDAREFSDFVRTRSANSSDATQAERMVWLARKWRWRYVFIELRNLFFLITAMLALLVVGVGLAGIAAGLLQWTTQLLPAGSLTWLGEDALKPNAANITAATGVLLAAVGGTRFLRDFFGDVQFWTTYEETATKSQQRRQILDTCAETLAHVLLDPDCERVAVISHSLGTTIAFDTILELARRNRATNPDNPARGALPLGKIQHFITLASPVDKVHYFFESHSGKYHRYNRVVEELRGDLGTFPFSASRRPLMHWVNFWDRADIIGGALQTPANRDTPSLAVDNVEVGSYLFPEPGAAHSAYFEHVDVIETIYRVVFDDAFSFIHPPTKPDGAPDFSAARLGGGGGECSTAWFQALMLVLPWLCATFLGVAALEIPAARAVLGYVLATVAGVLALGWLASLAQGHRHRLDG